MSSDLDLDFLFEVTGDCSSFVERLVAEFRRNELRVVFQDVEDVEWNLTPRRSPIRVSKESVPWRGRVHSFSVETPFPRLEKADIDAHLHPGSIADHIESVLIVRETFTAKALSEAAPPDMFMASLSVRFAEFAAAPALLPGLWFREVTRLLMSVPGLIYCQESDPESGEFDQPFGIDLVNRPEENLAPMGGMSTSMISQRVMQALEDLPRIAQRVLAPELHQRLVKYSYPFYEDLGGFVIFCYPGGYAASEALGFWRMAKVHDQDP